MTIFFFLCYDKAWKIEQPMMALQWLLFAKNVKIIHCSSEVEFASDTLIASSFRGGKVLGFITCHQNKNTAIGKQTATCGAVSIGSGSVVSEERVAAFILWNCRSPYVWERQLGMGTNCPPSCSLVPVTILAASTFSIPHPQTGREEPKVQRLMTEEIAPTEGLRMCVFERGRWGHCHLLQRGGWKRRKRRKSHNPVMPIYKKYFLQGEMSVRRLCERDRLLLMCRLRASTIQECGWMRHNLQRDTPVAPNRKREKAPNMRSCFRAAVTFIWAELLWTSWAVKI